MIYTLPLRKHSAFNTNIQLTLHEHLPSEHQAAVDRIEALTCELREVQEYKGWLESIAHACEIRITPDRLGEQDADSSSVLDKERDGDELSGAEERGRERTHSQQDIRSDREGV